MWWRRRGGSLFSSKCSLQFSGVRGFLTVGCARCSKVRNRKNKTFYQNAAALAISSFDLSPCSAAPPCAPARCHTKMNRLACLGLAIPHCVTLHKWKEWRLLTIPVVNKKKKEKNGGCGWFVERDQTKGKGMREDGRTLIKLPVLEMPGVHSRSRVKKTPLDQSARHNRHSCSQQSNCALGRRDGWC